MTDPPARHGFRWPPAVELRWAAAVSAALMLLTCAPYLWGLAIRPAGHYYSGFIANPDEHNVYLAYMRQTREGRVFLLNPFTSEPQPGRLLNAFFLALGMKARVTRLPLPVVYHAARVTSGWLLLMAVYCLAAQVTPSVPGRRLALMLAGVASGLGWVYPAHPGAPHPVDYGPGLVMPEAITFLTLLLNPLFSLSVFLTITVIALGAGALRAGSSRCAVGAGMAALVLGNIHTYNVIPATAVLGAFALYLAAARRLSWRGVEMGAVVAALAAPSLLYQVWLVRAGDVTLAVKAVETPVESPAPLYLALGLGIPLPLAAVGAAGSVLRGSDARRLLGMWLALGFAVVYLPVPFQRKLAEGLHIPVCILAAAAVEPMLRRMRGWRGVAVGAALVVLCTPSSALFVRRTARDLATNNTEYLVNLMPPLYLRADQRDALAWLGEHATFSDVVLCNSFLGSYAPSLAGVRVYLGHWAETLEFARKVNEFAAFMRADTPDVARRALWCEGSITYLLQDDSVYDAMFLPPAEREQGGFDPAAAPWLERVFASGRVSIYRAVEH